MFKGIKTINGGELCYNSLERALKATRNVNNDALILDQENEEFISAIGALEKVLHLPHTHLSK